MSLLSLRNWHLLVISQCCTTLRAMNRTFPWHDHTNNMWGPDGWYRSTHDKEEMGSLPPRTWSIDESKLKRSLIQGYKCFWRILKTHDIPWDIPIIRICLLLKRIILISTFFLTKFSKFSWHIVARMYVHRETRDIMLGFWLGTRVKEHVMPRYINAFNKWHKSNVSIRIHQAPHLYLIVQYGTLYCPSE